MITIRSHTDLDIETVEEIAFGGEKLRLHPDLLDEISTSRTEMTNALAGGERVYGVNTGMGYLAGKGLREMEQNRHQRNLLIGRAVGSPPYLTREESRALLTTRLVNLTSGYAGATPELCEFVVDRLNDGFTPAVPRSGVGCAGEVIPLSHAFQTFLGVGYVLGPDGKTVPAGEALKERGIEPYEPAAKEGIALLAGSPGAVALAIARRRSMLVLQSQLLAATACSIDALRAPLSVYGEHTGELSRDDSLLDVLGELRAALRGSTGERSETQAPVSFRVAPQTLAHLAKTIARFTEDIEVALGSVTDSPAFVDGSFVATGGFHEIDLAADFDTCSAALVRAAEISGQRVHRMLDRRFSGLEDQLTPNPGLSCGLVVVQKRVAGTLNELRRLANPASIGVVDTSLGQEDAMTFAFEAAGNLRRVEGLVRDVVACELLTARQAWAMRGTRPPEGLGEVAWPLIEGVEPIFEDRPLGEEIGWIKKKLEGGEFAPEFAMHSRTGGRT